MNGHYINIDLFYNSFLTSKNSLSALNRPQDRNVHKTIYRRGLLPNKVRKRFHIFQDYIKVLDFFYIQTLVPDVNASHGIAMACNQTSSYSKPISRTTCKVIYSWLFFNKFAKIILKIYSQSI